MKTKSESETLNYNVMELKKSPKANLENKRKIFIELGLVISILTCLYGFKTNSGVNRAETFGPVNYNPAEDTFIPITRQEEIKPVLPPPPKVVDLIQIVENNSEINDDLEFDNTEVTDNTAIYAAMLPPGKPEPVPEDATVFFTAEEMPEFPGGYPALLYFLSQNVKYPAIAIDNYITGKVTVGFIVNKDGSISDAKILRGVDQALDKEALRVVYSLPKWKPGKQSGKAVRVSYSIPINFVLK